MDQELRQWLINHDESAIDNAYYENTCPHFFVVDWREDDADIVDFCADCLGMNSLRAERRDNSLVIIHHANETKVPLKNDEGDRHITICTLNAILQPDYEIRFLVCAHGGDSAGFAVLPAADWQWLDTELPDAVRSNFIKLSELPNIFTEMTDEHLPEAARAHFQRMIERNRQ